MTKFELLEQETDEAVATPETEEAIDGNTPDEAVKSDEEETEEAE